MDHAAYSSMHIRFVRKIIGKHASIDVTRPVDELCKLQIVLYSHFIELAITDTYMYTSRSEKLQG